MSDRSLSTLPPEILHQICEHLTLDRHATGSYSPSTLSKLSRCSKQFYDIYHPLLYRGVGIYDDKRATLLRRTLFERPNLAVTVHGVEVIVDRCLEQQTSLILHPTNYISRIVARLFEQLVELSWIRMVVYRSIEAIVRTFDRAIYENVLPLDGEHVNGTDSRQDTEVKDPLYRLTSLQIDLSNLSHALDLHSIFLLPALRDLALEDCRPGVYNLELDPLNLTRLVLTRCGLGLSSLSTILGAYRGLCHFQYH